MTTDEPDLAEPELAHIMMMPEDQLADVLAGATFTAKALCGAEVHHRSKTEANVCRRCFDRYGTLVVVR